MRILGIETSCDETAVAVVEDGTTVLSSVVSSSASLHAQFGGILPELAARKQLDYMLPVLTQALNDAFPVSPSHVSPLTSNSLPVSPSHRLTVSLSHIDALAVTVGPGLIGSLLMGVETAKTLAFVTGKPIIPVNHVLAHIYGNFINIEQKTSNIEQKGIFNNSSSQFTVLGSHRPISFPAIALVVSGNHTELFLMESEKKLTWLGGTIDDAAGEAFDKTARLLGFGNRGGVAIEEAAKELQVTSFKFQAPLPRPLLHDKTLNFSFSGLKTAVMREWNKRSNEEPRTENEGQNVHSSLSSVHSSLFAHEIQEAITDILVAKTMAAAEEYGVQTVLLAGGVAANERLREKFRKSAGNNIHLHFPAKEFCTDNAVTTASYAFYLGQITDWHTIRATPNLSVEITET